MEATDQLIKATLESMHTKQLLNVLKSARYPEGYELFTNVFISVEDVKAVLETREHVPTKLEGKQARREAAKRKR